MSIDDPKNAITGIFKGFSSNRCQDYFIAKDTTGHYKLIDSGINY